MHEKVEPGFDLTVNSFGEIALVLLCEDEGLKVEVQCVAVVGRG
jgi:hypothetical protein